MPRSLWKGTLSFGLVTIPVQLFSATENRTPSFNQLRESDHSRISYKRVAKADDEEVSYDDIVKGYEYARDHYVVFTKDELDSLRPASSRSIEIEQFVPLEQIDPIYFDRTYYLAPEPSGAKAYALLAEAMTDGGSVAVCRITLRDKEYLATLRLLPGRPRVRDESDDDAEDTSGPLFVLETMHWPDEIRAFDLGEVDIDEMPEPRDKEVEMAKQLIASLTEDFDPTQYHDTYRERVHEAVEAKVEGQEVTVTEEAEEEAPVVDLMAALRQSVERAEERRKQEAS
ncbi:MAG TPA: Ku protein [Euzebyales bacterium]|nr:Ku protein [Euzebyales bacterium]